MQIRPRRRRVSSGIRELSKETYLDVSNLVYPLFLMDGANIKDEIHSHLLALGYNLEKVSSRLRVDGENVDLF